MSSCHRPWGTLDPERTVSVPWLFGSMLITGPPPMVGRDIGRSPQYLLPASCNHRSHPMTIQKEIRFT